MESSNQQDEVKELIPIQKSLMDNQCKQCLYNRQTSVPVNGSLPFDRRSSAPVSMASSRLDNTASILRLISVEQPKCKKKRTFKTILFSMAAVIFTISVIAVLSILYLVEIRKKTKYENTIKSYEKRNILQNPKQVCFIKAIPRKIDNLLIQPEIKEAINKLNNDIQNEFDSKVYHAFSANVKYMNEDIWSVRYGKMNYSNPTSKNLTKDTPFPVASITKVITVVMLNMLIDRNIIKSIDDPIHNYDKRFMINNPFDDQKITFRQLACMMSGLPREAPCNQPKNDNFCPYDSNTILQRIKKLSLILPPDTSPSYSNLGTALLGRILENQVNETFEEWVKKYIFTPLEMNNSGFVSNKSLPLFPLSTVKSKKADLVIWGWLNPAGGMYSTADDLGKLTSFLMQLSHTNLVKKSSYFRMFSQAYNWADGSTQGCPFEISPVTLENKTYTAFNKNGLIFGYAGLLSMVPDLKLGISIISAGDPPHSVLTKILSSFLPKIHDMLKRKTDQYKLPENPEYYVGKYELQTKWPLINEPSFISFKDGKLYVKLGIISFALSSYDAFVLELKPFKASKFNDCSSHSSGLYREKLFFDRPKSEEEQSRAKGFHINGIAIYGYAYFKRIE